MARKKTGKKAAIKKYSNKRNTKRTFKEEILLPQKPKRTGIATRHNLVEQLRLVNVQRKRDKYKYITKGKLSKKNKALYTKIKSRKSAVAKKYNSELIKTMTEHGYFKMQINHAKKYSLVGKNVLLGKINVGVERYNKNGTKALVKGKWISKKTLNTKIKRAVTERRLKSYMDLFDISKSEAREILKAISKKDKSANELKALIY